MYVTKHGKKRQIDSTNEMNRDRPASVLIMELLRVVSFMLGSFLEGSDYVEKHLGERDLDDRVLPL